MSYYIISDIIHYCNVKVPCVKEIPHAVIDYYDLTFVLDGTIVYIADGETYTLEKGDVLFLKPGSNRFRYGSEKKAHYISLNFRTDVCENINLPIYTKNAITPSVKNILSSFPNTHLPDNAAKKKCANLYNFILLELADSASLKSHNIHVRKMLDYIHAHLTHTISLDALSKQTNLTKEYCSWLFKKEIGKSPINYINKQKMTVAKNLILQNEMPLNAICSYLGYDNYNYFSRLFKKYRKTFPSAFKNPH